MDFGNGENCLPPSLPLRRGTRHPPLLLWTARQGSHPKLLAPSLPPIVKGVQLTTHPLLKGRLLDWNCFCNCCTVKHNNSQIQCWRQCAWRDNFSKTNLGVTLVVIVRNRTGSCDCTPWMPPFPLFGRWWRVAPRFGGVFLGTCGGFLTVSAHAVSQSSDF